MVVIVGVMVKFLTSFFVRLEQDKTSSTLSEQYSFESPVSSKRVMAPSLLEDTSASKTLSVVIPAYNEEMRLPSTLEETMAYLQRRRDCTGPNFTYEVIVVDDGSKDGTSTVAFDFVKKHGVDAVRVLRLPCNKGKGFAVKAGIMCSRGQEVLFMDADGATSISEIEKLESALSHLVESGDGREMKEEKSPSSWDRLAGRSGRAAALTASPAFEEKAAFVLGSRAHLQNEAIATRTFLRNIMMHGFHSLVTLVVGNTIRDTQCGFKVSAPSFLPLCVEVLISHVCMWDFTLLNVWHMCYRKII